MQQLDRRQLEQMPLRNEAVSPKEVLGFLANLHRQDVQKHRKQKAEAESVRAQQMLPFT